MTSTQRPVVRMWHGLVPADQAEPFHQHLLGNAVGEMRGIDGFLDATVLHRRDGDRVRITLLTTWADEEAVRRYAGDDTAAARDYPGDDQFGLEPDPHVTHFDLAYRLGADNAMGIEIIQPDGLDTPETYSHVVAASGSRMVFVAGQMSDDPDGNLVHPGDLAAQAEQVFANLGRALSAAGARPDQVTKITIYVVGHRREYLPVIEQARVRLFGDHKPADVLLGVETLAAPGYLIEVDAIAVV
ncbi:Rid family hydrolase [Pseudonocardia sp. CA-107938]|uniref:Rid family hydrolase n=1 Tax=Pseudonocardia sp. CA-107938 TaxID=3240021 RepID=UPI003D8DE1D7